MAAEGVQHVDRIDALGTVLDEGHGALARGRRLRQENLGTDDDPFGNFPGIDGDGGLGHDAPLHEDTAGPAAGDIEAGADQGTDGIAEGKGADKDELVGRRVRVVRAQDHGAAEVAVRRARVPRHPHQGAVLGALGGAAAGLGGGVGVPLRRDQPEGRRHPRLTRHGVRPRRRG